VRIVLPTLAALLAAGVANAQPVPVEQTDDDEALPVFLEEEEETSHDAFGSPGPNSVSLSLQWGFLPGIEYSRRIVPRVEAVVGLQSIMGINMPHVGLRMRVSEGRWTPYVYGRAAYVGFVTGEELEMYGGGAGLEYRWKSGRIVNAQAGLLAQRDHDRDAVDRSFSLLPDVSISIGKRW
jgi:hypothetical protein